jgi:hypothetical protein
VLEPGASAPGAGGVSSWACQPLGTSSPTWSWLAATAPSSVTVRVTLTGLPGVTWLESADGASDTCGVLEFHLWSVKTR